jgi:hypothetical protein
MTDQTIVPKNYKNPTKTYGKNIFDSINGKDYMDYWIYLKRVEVRTDNGIIFEHFKKTSVLSFEKATIMKYTLQSETFLQVILRISINRDLYDRSYMKIQDVAAGIGGMVKIVFTIGETLNYLTRMLLYRNYILQFFNLDYFNTSKSNKKTKFNRLSTNPPLIITNKNLLQIIPENKIELRDYIQINNSNIHLQFPNNSSSLAKKPSIPDFFFNKNKKGIKLSKFYHNSNNISNNINNTNNNNNFNNYINNSNSNVNTNTNNFYYNPYYTEYSNNKKNKKNLNDRIIKRKILQYRSFFDILFKKGSCKKIIETFKRFRKVSFLFEISRYIKSINELNIIKNIIFDEKQNNLLSYIYHYDYIFEKEKLIYDQISDHKIVI